MGKVVVILNRRQQKFPTKFKCWQMTSLLSYSRKLSGKSRHFNLISNQMQNLLKGILVFPGRFNSQAKRFTIWRNQKLQEVCPCNRDRQLHREMIYKILVIIRITLSPLTRLRRIASFKSSSSTKSKSLSLIVRSYRIWTCKLELSNLNHWKSKVAKQLKIKINSCLPSKKT